MGQQKQVLINDYKELEIKLDTLSKSRSPNQILQQLRSCIHNINNSEAGEIEIILNLISEIDNSMILSSSIDYRHNQENFTEEVERVSQEVIRIHQGINKISQEISVDVKNIDNRIVNLTNQLQELKSGINIKRQNNINQDKFQNDFRQSTKRDKIEIFAPVYIGAISFFVGVITSIGVFLIFQAIRN